jgi:hypothetical protein
VKACFEVGGFAFEFFKFPRLIPLLLRVIGDIKSEAVSMEEGVGNSVHGAGSRVNEFCPDHVARPAARVLPVDPNTSPHFQLKLPHRFDDRFAKSIKNSTVLSEGINKAHRLRNVEVNIVSDPPSVLGSRRQSLTGPRYGIIAQREEITLVHFAGKPELLGQFAAPATGHFLTVAVIVATIQRFGKIILGLGGITTGV